MIPRSLCSFCCIVTHKKTSVILPSPCLSGPCTDMSGSATAFEVMGTDFSQAGEVLYLLSQNCWVQSL